jgi:sphingolipid delta-4 desaturase
MSQAPTQYRMVGYLEPHLTRTKQILAKHPEIKKLFGNEPKTAFAIFGLVAFQTALAWGLQDQGFGWVLLAAFAIGAFANHALWVMIHDCTHNLVFRSSSANQWLQIFANLPIVFPSAINFRIYHLLHHRHQGERDLDADLVMDLEARFASNVWWRKALWLLLFPMWQSLRVTQLKTIPFVNRWVVANWGVVIAYVAALTAFSGSWMPVVYLILSATFAVGLHPVGARWIQEHYTVDGTLQETYSYYGPLNAVAFNVGYHNEHHDFMMVPWNRLPEIRAAAPEYYNSLTWHSSWTQLLMRFLFDPSISLYCRITRQRNPEAPGQALPVSSVNPDPQLNRMEASGMVTPGKTALA